MAEGNWLGIAMPEEYGGAGLGITEAAILMQAVAESGACMSGASAIHLNIFGLNPVVVFGTEAQKRRMLPPMIAGQDKACFGVTEPNAGLNTTQITTRAERRGDRYVINGTKIWTSTAQVATKILLLARTTPLDQVKRHSHGLTLFYTDARPRACRGAADPQDGPPRGRLRTWCSSRTWRCRRKTASARKARGSAPCCTASTPNACWSPPRRSASAAPRWRAPSRYARERVVFGRPIGQNQAIQHPLAKCWAELEAANLMVMKAAWLYDHGPARAAPKPMPRSTSPARPASAPASRR